MFSSAFDVVLYVQYLIYRTIKIQTTMKMLLGYVGQIIEYAYVLVALGLNMSMFQSLNR
jgi:hypothetical protein